MRPLLAFLATLLCALSPAQAIYTATEQAVPGGTLAVRGDALDSTARITLQPYNSDGTKAAAFSLTPLSASGVVALVTVPGNAQYGVYEVSASTRKGATNSVWANRPRVQWIDASECLQGGSVRIVGRNLHPVAGLTPTVALTPTTGQPISCPVTETGDDCLKATVPSGAATGSYTLTVNNGLSGSASVSNGVPISVVAGSDPFGLGVSWGREFAAAAANVVNVKTDVRLIARGVAAVGDGVHDDSPAFIAALDYTGGGGTIYAPAGTYLVDDGQRIPIYSGRVIQGAGKGQTILKVGTGPGTGTDPNIAFWSGGVSDCGLCDLTITNVSTAPRNVFGSLDPFSPESHCFVARVDFQLGQGLAINLAHLRGAAFQDCSITQASYVQPTRISDSQDLRFLRNVVRYQNGRVTLDYGRRMVVEANDVGFSNAARSANPNVETGGIELNYGQQVLVKGNTVAGLGGVSTKPRDTDGELLMSQYGTLFEVSWIGMVRTAVGRTLIPQSLPATTDWLGEHLYLSTPSAMPRMAVAIVSGKGMGQWRRVASWTLGSMQVDRAWQVPPDATSRFYLFALVSYQQTHVGNALSGSVVGISTWDGSVDCAIDGNTLTNTGAIAVRGDSVTTSSIGGRPESNVLFNLAWDDSIRRNSVVDSLGAIPAAIGVISLDETYASYGAMVLGVDVTGNSVTSGGYADAAPYLGRPGIQVQDDYHTAVDATLSLGTIVQANVLTGGSLYTLSPMLPAYRQTDNRVLPVPVVATGTSN